MMAELLPCPFCDGTDILKGLEHSHTKRKRWGEVKMKMYFYAISYFHSKGNGCCQLYRDKKIKTIKDFDEVRRFIEENNGLETVAIINIMLIGKEWR